MANENSFDVNEQFRMFYSELQVRHDEQLALLDTLKSRIDEARSSLIESQSAELDDFREMKRRIDWALSEDRPDDGIESDSTV